MKSVDISDWQAGDCSMSRAFEIFWAGFEPEGTTGGKSELEGSGGDLVRTAGAACGKLSHSLLSYIISPGYRTRAILRRLLGR